MRRWWRLAGLLMVMLLFLSACGGKEPAGQETVVVQEVKPAAQFTIALSEDTTTGYGWQYGFGDEGILREAGNEFAAQGEGSSGIRTWTFEAEAPGTVEVRFEYKQNEGAEAVETIAYTFHVNEELGINLESSFGSISDIPQPQMK